MTLTRLALLSALLAAAAFPASSQEAKFGGQLTLSKPQGDLDTAVDGKLGYGLGVHVFVGLKDGHALVPRFDYIEHKNSRYGFDYTYKTMKLGADYNYFVSKKTNEGFYLIAGLSYNSIKLDYPGGSSDTKSNLGYGAGLGYMFTPHLGCELKYETVSYSTGGDDFKAPTLNLSFLARF